ncbi:MAG TPA: hypothetical protein VH186_01945 [Chloroflexia bacterium]|nr:hypothetical protein [Chloroflexia bacterium]
MAVHLRLQRLDLGARLVLFVDLPGNFAQRADQILRRDRLQEILGYTDLDRLLCVFEFVVATEDNNLGER